MHITSSLYSKSMSEIQIFFSFTFLPFPLLIFYIFHPPKVYHSLTHVDVGLVLEVIDVQRRQKLPVTEEKSKSQFCNSGSRRGRFGS